MDRLLIGFLIGLFGGIIKNSLDWFLSLFFKITSYPDFMIALLISHPSRSTGEYIFGLLVELGFSGMLGISFIYFAYRTKNKKTLWFKGILFGSLSYLTLFSLGTFFKVPLLDSPSLTTSIATLITSSIFGVILGFGILWWGRKIGDLDTIEANINNNINKIGRPRKRVLLFPHPAKKIEQRTDEDANVIHTIKPKKIIK